MKSFLLLCLPYLAKSKSLSVGQSLAENDFFNFQLDDTDQQRNAKIARIAENAVHERERRIAGGSAAGSVSYFVSLRFNIMDSWNHYCGGALLDSTHVLTAAHCIVEDLVLKDGAFINEQQYGIASFVRHPGFDKDSRLNDIAILTLSSPASSDPISVASAASDDSPGSNAKVYGMGLTGNGFELAKQVYTASVPLSPDASCKNSYPTFNTLVQFCAGTPTIGVCTGDNGGPIVSASGKLIGIVSDSSCIKPMPLGRFTRVRSFLSFLSQNGLTVPQGTSPGPVVVPPAAPVPSSTFSAPPSLPTFSAPNALPTFGNTNPLPTFPSTNPLPTFPNTNPLPTFPNTNPLPTFPNTNPLPTFGNTNPTFPNNNPLPSISTVNPILNPAGNGPKPTGQVGTIAPLEQPTAGNPNTPQGNAKAGASLAECLTCLGITMDIPESEFNLKYDVIAPGEGKALTISIANKKKVEAFYVGKSGAVLSILKLKDQTFQVMAKSSRSKEDDEVVAVEWCGDEGDYIFSLSVRKTEEAYNGTAYIKLAGDLQSC